MSTKSSLALMQLGFRPLFLGAAIFSVLAMAQWAGLLAGQWSLMPYGGSYWWHGHEMLFGFVSAVVVGFLLTAVQNWTGVPGVKGLPLTVLVATWLAGRVLLWANPEGLGMLTAAVDLLFLPLAALYLSRPLIRVKQWRNLFFVPVLVLMTLANGLTHYTVLGGDAEAYRQGVYLMVMLVTAIMSVIGGRVMPFFTANGTATTKVTPLPWLDRPALAGVWLLVMHWLCGQPLPDAIVGSIAIVTAVLQGWRCWRWRIWITWQVPLLWSLHLSYWFIPLGLLALGLHYTGAGIPSSTALHVLTVGAMGNMILSMMSRVSLGHTGRRLHPHWLMSVAFGLLLVAAVVRTLMSWLWHSQILSWLSLSALLWCLAFTLFVICYWRVLLRPRVDGRAG